MRKTKRSFKKLAPLTLGLVLSLVGVLSLSGRVGAVSVTVNTDSIPVSNRQLLLDDGNYAPDVFQSLNTSNSGVVIQQNAANAGTVASFGYDIPSLTECQNSKVTNISWSYTLSFKSFLGGFDANNFGLSNTLTLKSEPVLMGGYMAPLNNPNPGVNIFPTSAASTGGSGMSVLLSTGMAAFESTNHPSQNFTDEQIAVQADLSNLQDPILVSELPDLMIAMGLRSEYNGGNIEWSFSKPSLQITYDDSSCPVTLATDPDTATTTAGTPVPINLLGNDTGSGISVSKVDGQSISSGQTITLSNGSGTVTLNPDNTITFTPASGFTGPSNFSYSITDGTQTIDTGVVMVTVVTSTSNSVSNTTPSTTTPVSTAPTNTLAKTGANLTLALTLAMIGLIGGFGVKRVAKR